ncbi:MAG TPA: hypothetical protein VEI47_10600, partial [Gemmatimonadales bacterium]|nr:hypothetical protein [Gemmatimonadales bacterium]
ANGETYWTVVSSLIASPFDLTGPGTVSIAAPLQPLALTHSLDCDFRISQFASAVQTSLPLNLASGSVIDPSGSSYLAVLGNFGPLEEGILFNNADLLSYAHATDDSDVATGAMAYGTPAPDQLQPFGFVRYSKSVRFLLPGTTPPRAVFVAGMDQTLDATSLCTGAVIPVLEPVSNLEVAGMDARQPLQGVGLAPTISWTPPAVGTPVRYTVTINLLSATTANNTTSSSVASIVTSQTQVPVPSGLLESGKIYVISIITEVALTGVTSGTSSYSVSNTITP